MRFFKIWGTFFFLFFTVTAMAQNPADAVAEMDYYLPDDVTYNESIPTPEEVIGIVPGEWHVRHDQLVQYMRAVAEASDRVTLTEYGQSYENRTLLYLTITSPSNHQNIEEIRKNHVALTDADRSDELNVEEMPIVFYMGYSIHGDESSGSNASMLAAYHFAAAQGPEIEEQLENGVILLDPSFNPDGLSRFAHWANTHRGKNINPDPNNMEQNQAWPSGRTNHYWFDLNRDWMLVQHPESQGRIKNFYHWRPNILTDHHEMGTNSTFFFQPGIQSRTNPLTPQKNQDLTKEIAKYHAEILDENKRLYYSEESYDDFYYGKGSTYPDINGSIGILFEQGSSRGHAQESINGVLTFPFTIKNQFLTSLSTFKAGTGLRTEILNYQREFFQNAAEEAADADVEGYVYGAKNDQGRTHHFTELLKRHQIKVYELAEQLEVDDQTFEPGSAYVIPADQKQQRMIEALFQQRTTFSDSLFYDVSAWTMPFAFNLPFAELEGNFSSDLMGNEIQGIPSLPRGKLIGGQSDYAYVFEWDEYYAPRALNRLLKNDVRARVAAEPFEAMAGGQQRSFDYGTIMVPVGPQNVNEDEIHSLIQEVAQNDVLTIYAINSGLTSGGIDFGSNTFENLEKPNVAIISGDGTSGYEVGEVWHLLDQRYNMTPTLLTMEELGSADLSRYNVMIMTTGGYNDFSDGDIDDIKRWLRSGGTLIATRYANNWIKESGLADISFIEEEEDTTETEPKPYAEMDAARGAQYIGGAIFNAELDLTHPLGYGFDDEDIYLFRSSTMFMEKPENPYATPVVYTDEPLAAGYISEENLEQLPNTAGVVVSGYGSGKIISFIDNPNFRAFWYGTNKLFMNAIFFGQTISGSSAN